MVAWAYPKGFQPSVPRWGLGGFQQRQAGYAPFQISGSQVALVRLGYQVRVSDPRLTRGLFVSGSVGGGNAWDQAQDIWRGAKRKGFSLYLGADTAFGPGLHRSGDQPGGGLTVMLFVGRPDDGVSDPAERPAHRRAQH